MNIYCKVSQQKVQSLWAAGLHLEGQGTSRVELIDVTCSRKLVREGTDCVKMSHCGKRIKCTDVSALIAARDAHYETNVEHWPAYRANKVVWVNLPPGGERFCPRELGTVERVVAQAVPLGPPPDVPPDDVEGDLVMIVDFDFDLSSVWSCPHSVRGALAKGSLCKGQDHKWFLSESLWELLVKLTSAAFSTLNSNLDERS